MELLGPVCSDTLNENRSFMHTTITFFQNLFDYDRMYAISQQHGAAPHTTSITAFWLLRTLSIYHILHFLFNYKPFKRGTKYHFARFLSDSLHCEG
jgi:hypothetical protein